MEDNKIIEFPKAELEEGATNALDKIWDEEFDKADEIELPFTIGNILTVLIRGLFRKALGDEEFNFDLSTVEDENEVRSRLDAAKDKLLEALMELAEATCDET